MKKDVLFLCQFFYPEYNSSATLPFDTAKYLASQGLSVDALVGYPKEYNNVGKVPTNETVDNVNIKRIKYLELDRKKKLNRLINYFSFTLAALLRVGILKKYKSVIVYSNPPILPLVPIIAKKLFGTDFIFVAYDVYPEVAFASGALKPNGIISKIMQRINKSLYKNASGVITLTDEMKEFLLKNRPDLCERKVSTIANWAHEGTSDLTNEAKERFGIKSGDFVVSYFGNMGTCQDVNTMIGAAKLLQNYEHIKFLFVGHGNKKPVVEKQTENLKNVRVEGYLTGNDFLHAAAVSSCFIVSLEKGLMGTCAPSKYYSYLQAGKPVIAVVEKESYLAKEIDLESIGFSVEIGECEKMKDYVLDLYNSPEMQEGMGYRARVLYESEYDYSVAMKKYERAVKKVAGIK